MKFAAVEKIFSDKVVELISNGYAINTNTMEGSQGEMAKVDFRKGSEFFRLYMEKGCDYDCGEYVVIRFGKCRDEIRGLFCGNTIWNSHLDVMEERIFWIVSSRRGKYWFVEGDDGKEMIEKHYNRRKASFVKKVHEFGKEAFKFALPKIREARGHKKDGVDVVRRVWRAWDDDGSRWYADSTTRGVVRLG